MRRHAPDPAPPTRMVPRRDARIGEWLRHACGDGDVRLVMEVTSGRDVFLEGRGDDLTCAASLQLDRDGGVARALCFHTGPVQAPAPWVAQRRPPLLPLVERYFAKLNGGDFDAAAACFSDDCLYVHPPYRPGDPRAEFHGRRELAAIWPARRGTGRVPTRIDACVQDGNHAFIEGVAAGGSFLSTIVLDSSGLIERYVAFHSPELIPRISVAGQRTSRAGVPVSRA